MPKKIFDEYAERALEGEQLAEQEALAILRASQEHTFHVFAAANDLRCHFKGEKIDLCSVVNAKSGLCPEDCAFCAQSIHHATGVAEYALMDEGEILEHAYAAEKNGARRLGIVTSGRGIDKDEVLDRICLVLKSMQHESRLGRCASLGSLNRKQLQRLKLAGLQKIHHNIETSESFFPTICSTHTYADRVETVRAAKDAGLSVCCGGIFGMGESDEQRVEMALALRELQVDSIPLNFLNPIPGTRMENAPALQPLEILKIIAMFRFLLPEKDIRVCGGRERGLRSLQPLMYLAGANCTMVGNYLTTPGRKAAEDLEMITDLGLRY
jgi:biotin synthase